MEKTDDEKKKTKVKIKKINKKNLFKNKKKKKEKIIKNPYVIFHTFPQSKQVINKVIGSSALLI